MLGLGVRVLVGEGVRREEVLPLRREEVFFGSVGSVGRLEVKNGERGWVGDGVVSGVRVETAVRGFLGLGLERGWGAGRVLWLSLFLGIELLFLGGVGMGFVGARYIAL